MSGKRRGGKNNAAKGQRFELTDEQKLEIREAFDLFDTDGSGMSFLPSSSWPHSIASCHPHTIALCMLSPHAGF